MPILIDHDVVIKTGLPDEIAIEARKLAAAGRIAESTGHFVVPKLLEVDCVKGRIVMQRLAGLEGVRQKGVHGHAWRKLAELIGLSLATIHRCLELPESVKIRLPSGLDAPYANAFLHGDFSGENVCVTGDGKLAIIDWQMSPRYGGAAT